MKPSPAQERALQRYRDTLSATHRMIDPQHDRSPTLALVQERALERIDRVKRILRALGDPQDQIPLVHVAGTSGKGSTATAIASILVEAGYRTGLHTSPYLQVATEKLQIDRQLISIDEFSDGVATVQHAAADVLGPDEGPLTYGELWAALTFSWFARQQIDIGVVEVGAGGRFDLTNVFTPVVSVITPIGIDHVETLGSTLDAIAWHKAGIIKAGVPVAVSVQDPIAFGVIDQEAILQRAPVLRALPDQVLLVELTQTRPELGRFEIENAATALATASLLERQGFPVSCEAKMKGLLAARIPGRLETMPGDGRIVLDGAHNPQKAAALATSLEHTLPVETPHQRILVFGVLEAKDLDAMVDLLAPEVTAVICTEPGVFGKDAASAERAAAAFHRVGFEGSVSVVPEPERALESAITMVDDLSADAVLVTGSMYLVGNLRGNWFEEAAILLEQTPWPNPSVREND